MNERYVIEQHGRDTAWRVVRVDRDDRGNTLRQEVARYRMHVTASVVAKMLNAFVPEEADL